MLSFPVSDKHLSSPVLQNSTRVTELMAFRGTGSVVHNTFATKTPSLSLLRGPCVLKEFLLPK